MRGGLQAEEERLRKVLRLVRGLLARRPARAEDAGSAAGPQVWLSDEAIKEWDEDVLGRRPLVEGICRAMAAWPAGTPLVVGLMGDWGEGKTSVLNLVVGELERQGQHVIIQFDPWFFNSPEALIQGFLTSIESAILDLPEHKAQKAGREVWRKARRTLSSLPSVSLFGFGANFENLAERVPGLEELRADVSGVCRSVGGRIVVVLDDVDRLPAEEVRTVLKLVKLWNTFSGFVFLLAFDRRAVEGKLREELEGDPRLLEKLIQVEIRLPAPERTAVGRFLDKGLDQIQAAYGITYESNFEERMGNMWRSGMSRRITTLRAVKRFLNAAAFAVPLVSGEANYADLFGLEFVRVFYPEVYEDVRSHRDLFCGGAGEGAWAGQENERRKAHFEGCLGSLSDDDGRETVKGVLSEIFPVFAESVLPLTGGHGGAYLGEWSREQRAAAPNRIDVYFQLGVPSGQVSDAWVRTTIRQVNDAAGAEVRGLVGAALENAKEKGTLRSALDRLLTFAREVERARARDAIWGVVEREGLYSTESPAFEMSEHHLAGSVVFALAAAFEDCPEIQEVLAEVVRTGPLSFASGIVHFAVPELNHVIRNWTHVDVEGLRGELRRRVRTEYVEAGRNLVSEEPRWGVRVLYELQDKELVTDYLVSLFKGDSRLVAPFLRRYVDDVFGERGFRMQELERLVDVSALRAATKGLDIPEELEEDERFAVERFLGAEE